MTEKRYALLSVSDKTGIVAVAEALVAQGIQLLSTGGTLAALADAGVPVQSVETVTHFPEMMNGRVKTLHPKIHGGLLSVRANAEHVAAMVAHDIPRIDFVIVNLYPFKQTVLRQDCTFDEAVEQIDIGGPSMLRSAAKNHQSVTVVTDPRDYDTLLAQLAASGETSLAFRQYLARKVYQLTAHYDALIATYLDKALPEADDFTAHAWDSLTLTYEKQQDLRYGENGHQEAVFYRDVFAPDTALVNAKQIHGKELSYNNIKDAHAAVQIAREFNEPCAVAVKHMNPCGVAIGETIEQAFQRCYDADPVSIFGGIVVCNRPVSAELAEQLAGIFLEIIIAPAFSEEAVNILTRKKNLRLLVLPLTVAAEAEREYVSVSGGLLVQSVDRSSELPHDTIAELPAAWEVMTETTPDAATLRALNFTMRVCKHVKSNAIVIGNEVMTLGIGAGQMNRVGAAKIALEQAVTNPHFKAAEAVMASDAFFPMPDTVALAHDFGIPAIIQPGGSLKDADSVDYCNAHQIAMVKTGIRHFRH